MSKFVWPERSSQVAFPVAPAGYPLLLGCAFTTAILALLELTVPALIGLMTTFCICGFFRDPDRIIPNAQGAVVSPADGKVIAVGVIDDSPFSSGTTLKISIFMSVFNVHVNRMPYDARVRQVCYSPGKFFSANLDKASVRNEHNAVFLEIENGGEICVVQVAGLIARRIICKVAVGDQVVRGQRFGLICFGSRVDVYLPGDFTPAVAVGDKVKAGTFILGQFAKSEKREAIDVGKEI
ncbi:MAG: phosphatidylserine decarboxylase family protein [Desulfobacterales bacterium]|nr:MAG: phosphatidylserine decarboxylase family protein [Desulfobacterales bacterium]